MVKKFEANNLKIELTSIVQPLFFDPNCPMVKTLVKAYQDVTGDFKHQPESIGGGTYAKGVNNCIGYGMEFAGDDNHIHDANEFLKVDDWLLSVEIFCEAIKNLMEL